jgi:hypothetical protein
VLGSGSSEYEHGQTDFRGNQHTTKATAPMTDRTRTVGVTPSRSTHQCQTNQLAGSTIDLSRTTAAVSPSGGARTRTRMVPNTKPIRKAMGA